MMGKKKEVPARPPAARRRKGRRDLASMVQRLEGMFSLVPKSADSVISRNHELAREKSRELCLDNDYAKGYLRGLTTNVIGGGITLQSQVKNARGERLNRRVNDAIETAWQEWGKAPNCDVSGALSFAGIQSVALRSTAEAGEVFIRLVSGRFGNGKVPLALELIESDRLDIQYSVLSDRGNKIRMGIEVDGWGRPLFYHFFRYSPNDIAAAGFDAGKERIVVPADEVIHLFLKERPGQTRGLSWLATTVGRMGQLNGYEYAAVVRARAAACLMGFITSSDDALRDPDDGEDPVSTFEPGIFRYLNPGESVEIPSFDAPAGELEPFVRSQLRAASAGLGVAYETLSGDYSSVSYSSARQSLLLERDNWRVIQQWVIEKVCQRVYEAWIGRAVMAGVLPIPDYERSPERYHSPLWVPRGWRWVDPEKEVNAYVTALENNLVSPAEVIQENGGDIEKVYASISQSHELAEDYGLEKPRSQPTENEPRQDSEEAADQPTVEEAPTDETENEAAHQSTEAEPA